MCAARVKDSELGRSVAHNLEKKKKNHKANHQTWRHRILDGKKIGNGDKLRFGSDLQNRSIESSIEEDHRESKKQVGQLHFRVA